MKRTEDIFNIIILILTIFYANYSIAENDKQYFRVKINKIESKIHFSKIPTDQIQNRHVINKTLKKILEFGGINDSLLFSPSGIKTDKKGNIFVLDYIGKFVKKFTSKGKYIKKYGGPGKGPGEFTNPTRIYLDEKDSLYVYDNQSFMLTAFLKRIFQLKVKPGNLASEFCPLDENNIILLKSSYNSFDILEKYNLKGDLLNKYESVLDNTTKPKRFDFIGEILNGNILRLSSTRFVHIPEYFNQLFFYNNNKLEKIISILDQHKNPIFEMEFAGNMYNMDFRKLNKYQVNHSAFLVDNEIYIVSKSATIGKSLMIDIYNANNGFYRHSFQIPLMDSFYIIHITKNKIYMITTDLKVKVFSYE